MTKRAPEQFPFLNSKFTKTREWRQSIIFREDGNWGWNEGGLHPSIKNKCCSFYVIGQQYSWKENIMYRLINYEMYG